MKIILASASERRVELLKRLVDDFDVIVSDFNEDTIIFEENIDDYVKKIALGKGMNIKNKVSMDSLIISADTIVTLENKIFGKPKDEEDAFKMLKALQGKSHYVYSGVCIINTTTGNIIQESVKTEVRFSKLNDEEIRKYICTKEPMDKAGAYGIQGFGGAFVESIKGCYYNVVGLPLNKVKAMLDEVLI